MGDELVSLVHLHLAQSYAAAAAPRHGVVALVDEHAAEALLEKRTARLAGVQGATLLEGADRVPEFERAAFQSGKIDLRLDLLERHGGTSEGVRDAVIVGARQNDE